MLDGIPAPLEAPPRDFAAILYAEPGALGLIANIMAGLVVAVENMLLPPFTPVALSLAGESQASSSVMSASLAGVSNPVICHRSVFGWCV